MDYTFWFDDIFKMHKKFGFHESVDKMTPEQLKELLDFRIRFLEEELNEIKAAVASPDMTREERCEEVVDGLIDLIVVAIGTLDLYAIDCSLAWNEVHRANMAKERGIKEGRPNPLGLPDLVKSEGWEPPSHAKNIGILRDAFKT